MGNICGKQKKRKWDPSIYLGIPIEWKPREYFQRTMSIKQQKQVLLARKKRYSFQYLSFKNEDFRPWGNLVKVRHVIEKILKNQKSLKDLAVPSDIGFLKKLPRLRGRRKLAYAKSEPAKKLGRTKLKEIKDVVLRERKVFKGITQLKITLEKDYKETLTPIGLLFQPNLQTLQLRLELSNLKDIDVEIFGSQIGKKLKKLQHLTLLLGGRDGFFFSKKEEGIRTLFSRIGDNLNSLKTLNLELSINYEESKNLSEWIGNNLKTLQSLNLKLRYDEITDNGLNILSSKIGTNLTQLKTFQLNLLEFSRTQFAFQNETIKFLVEHIGSNLQSLEELSLQLPSLWKNEYGRSIILEQNTAEYFKSLKKLDLKIHHHNQRDKDGVTLLCELLQKNLSQLESLTFQTWDSSITIKTFGSIASEIRDNLQTLKHLSLTLSYCHSIEVLCYIEFLGILIGDNLKHLESLELKFSLPTESSSGTFNILANRIEKHLPRLQRLKAYFSGCCLDVDKAHSLKERLKHIRYLTIIGHEFSIVVDKTANVDSINFQ